MTLKELIPSFLLVVFLSFIILELDKDIEGAEIRKASILPRAEIVLVQIQTGVWHSVSPSLSHNHEENRDTSVGNFRPVVSEGTASASPSEEA